MSRVFAGIGSRETPIEILALMRSISVHLTIKPNDYWLRTGGADGADQAFALGAGHDSALNYLPWVGYNKDKFVGLIASCEPTNDAIEIARMYHPAWDKCSNGAKKLHGRNAQIILGKNLDHPVDFVVCWTKGGEITGGTGLGIKIAMDNQIPVFNLFHEDHVQDLKMEKLGGNTF